MREPQTSAFEELIAALGSDNAPVRAHARQTLVARGRSVIPALIEALGDPNEDIRWGAAKALGEIGDLAAAPAIVAALEDDNSGVRWIAAEAIVSHPNAHLKPLLEALTKRPDSVWLREGAHHFLRTFEPADLTPALAQVRRALEGIEPALTVPLAAEAALKAL